MTERALYDVVFYAWMGVAAATFLLLLFVSAPYGRHARRGWGPGIGATAAWIVMEAPAALAMLVFFLLGDRRTAAVPLVFLALWEIHYVHRTLIFPFRRRNGTPRTPLLIVLFGVLFNGVNGYLQGRWLFALAPHPGTAWLVDPRFLLGIALFVAGMAINVHSDEVLRRLRRPGEQGYKIPQAGLHRWVASPNYLGEVIEWTGWAVLTWSLGGLAFVLWTAANLVPRALSHRRWYRATFPDYPAERKAIVPFVL